MEKDSVAIRIQILQNRRLKIFSEKRCVYVSNPTKGKKIPVRSRQSNRADEDLGGNRHPTVALFRAGIHQKILMHRPTQWEGWPTTPNHVVQTDWVFKRTSISQPESNYFSTPIFHALVPPCLSHRTESREYCLLDLFL